MSEEHITLARRALDPRGPDGSEAVRSRYGVLIATRLAIVDPEGPGRAVLQTRGGRFRIAFNGEVYNHHQLRAELRDAHLRLASERDTEVVLQLVAESGSAAAAQLRGQFAYLVEDLDRGLLYAARDSYGVCPLWHGRCANGSFAFASSPALLLDLGVEAASLCNVPQGHTLECDLRRGTLRLAAFTSAKPADATATAPMADLVRDSIFEKVPSEVPYATIVGGLDSSLVTAVCAAHHHRPCCTITVRSAVESQSTDVRNTRLLEKKYNIPSVVDELDANFLEQALPAVIEQLCSANYLAVLAGLMSSKAAHVARRHGAKVLLTGGGADELFGGYDFVWNAFPRAAIEDNLEHVRRQTGTFECHREDASISPLGVEPRPAYFSSEIARALEDLPLSVRLPGLPLRAPVDKAVLREVARGIRDFPEPIVRTRKEPIFRSTSMSDLFSQVARELLPETEARDWFDAHMRGTSWEYYLFGHKHGATLVHKMWGERFPMLLHLQPRTKPPDYERAEDYGAYHPTIGMPVLQRRSSARRPRGIANISKTTSRGLMSF